MKTITLLALAVLLTGCSTLASYNPNVVALIGQGNPRELCNMDLSSPLVQRELKIQQHTCPSKD